MLETLLPIFLSGIDLHGLLLEPTSVAAMGAQAALLVDTRVVEFIELEVSPAFPFLSTLVIVARPSGILGVKVDSTHKNAIIVVEQVDRVDGKRDHGQAMRIETQGADEIAVGVGLAGKLIFFVKNGGTDDDAMIDGIDFPELVFGAVAQLEDV